MNSTELKFGINIFTNLLQRCDHDPLGHGDDHSHYFLDHEHDLGDDDDPRDHDLRYAHGLRGGDRPSNLQYQRLYCLPQQKLGFCLWQKRPTNILLRKINFIIF